MFEIKADDYSVFVGDVLSKADELIATHYARCKKVILVDENTAKHCLPQVQQLPSLLNAEVLQIQSGEENKSVETTSRIWKYLSSIKIDRTALFINLGGGVIGDMGGFAASTYKRGIDFINFPTTLLSQVDASIGGKLGIDFEGLKNQIGIFKCPKAVFVHTEFLQTLDERQVVSGFAEIIKHSLIASRSYFDEIQELNFEEIMELDNIIRQSVEIKNQIVLRDFEEKNIRKTLNFGHTIGHAIESHFMKGEKPLLHGEAIAIGMICETYLSYLAGFILMEDAMEVANYINSVFPKVELNSTNYHRLIELMQHDKKNTRAGINFTLLKSIGVAEVNQVCDVDQIVESLDFYKNH
ncbi:MAG: 3-dehydroquinate synthase [Flavobacteriales bacterium]|nr:3-dehydroquinate synthase [Flavobacteriales bacterium]